MNKPNFTDGPWNIERSVSYGSAWIESEAGRSIVDMYHYNLKDSTVSDPVLFIKENAEANLHLIAAAPDLYHALKALELQALQSSVNDGNEWGQDALFAAKIALEKARGESS